MKKLLLTACALILGWGGVDAAVNPCIKLVNAEYKAEVFGTQLFYRLPTPMVSGTNYTLTMRVYFENPLSEGLGFWPCMYKRDQQEGATLYTGFDAPSFNPGVWTTVTCNFKAEANYDALQFPIGHVVGVMRIDDVKLVAEGSQENLVDNGTFNEPVEHKVIGWQQDKDQNPDTWYSFSWATPTFTYEADYDDGVAPVFTDFVLKNYAFTPVTVEQAAAEKDKPIVLMDTDGNVFNGTYGKYEDGIHVSSPKEFDAKNYQLLVESINIDGENNTYTIKLNEDGNYKRYLQASPWGHAFFNSDLANQQGFGGQNGAVWTVASMDVNTKTYSLRSLGVKQGNIMRGESKDPRTDGYLMLSGSEVRIESSNPVAWTFATCEALPAVDEALTLSVNRILDFTNVTDVDAYIATGIADNKVIMKKVTGAVPANTGLVLIQKNNKTVISIPTCGEATEDVTGNLLVATTTQTEVPVGAYVLAGSQQTLGWYSVVDNIPTLPAGKCYLKAPQAGVKSLVMSFDEETTGIAEAEVQREDAVYHNLQGMRVSKPTTGIFITRGKKVIINK